MGNGRDLAQRDLNVPDAKVDGRRITQAVVASYDFAEHGGAIGDIGLGEAIPANAVIHRVWYDVLTTFTTAAADAGTIGLEAGAADLVTAVAVSDVGDPWDAGLHEGIPDGTMANAVKVGTDPVQLIVDVAVQVVTAGKVIFYVEYSITGA